MTRRSQYPPELRERAVRMVVEVTSNYDSQWAAIGPARPRGPELRRVRCRHQNILPSGCSRLKVGVRGAGEGQTQQGGRRGRVAGQVL
jgi:transposase-like protein